MMCPLWATVPKGRTDMGGNARAIDRATGKEMLFEGKLAHAERIHTTAFDGKFAWYVLKTLLLLDHECDSIWAQSSSTHHELFGKCRAFSGSSRLLMASETSGNRTPEHLRVLGDIDVMIPHEKLGELFDVLARLEGKSLWHNRVTYVGQNKHQQSGHQINAIFAFAHPESSWEQFVQIDFEGVEFDVNGTPTEFSEFAHSTSPSDADVGIKGVAHKYLLTNLIRASSELQDALVLTEKSPPPPNCRISMSKKIPREYAFSVDRGLRKKLEPVMHNGTQFRVGDKRVFRELATDESIYDTNIANIARAALGKSVHQSYTHPTDSGAWTMWSFVGLLYLCHHYRSNAIMSRAFELMLVENLYGPGAQKLSRTSCCVDQDVKNKIIERMYVAFPHLKEEFGERVDEMSRKFQENYFDARSLD